MIYKNSQDVIMKSLIVGCIYAIILSCGGEPEPEIIGSCEHSEYGAKSFAREYLSSRGSVEYIRLHKQEDCEFTYLVQVTNYRNSSDPSQWYYITVQPYYESKIQSDLTIIWSKELSWTKTWLYGPLSLSDL